MREEKGEPDWEVRFEPGEMANPLVSSLFRPGGLGEGAGKQEQREEREGVRAVRHVSGILLASFSLTDRLPRLPATRTGRCDIDGT